MKGSAKARKPRIYARLHTDGYYYVFCNGKRITSTAYGDEVAAGRAVQEMRKQSS